MYNSVKIVLIVWFSLYFLEFRKLNFGTNWHIIRIAEVIMDNYVPGGILVTIFLHSYLGQIVANLHNVRFPGTYYLVFATWNLSILYLFLLGSRFRGRSFALLWRRRNFLCSRCFRLCIFV